ncbi:MAG: hypothetical protein F4246_10605 [Rhodothermaceae bacterium]|nr:hypothetical protein [Rhodothermaceae bacterium]MXX58770.1 hypothetical protein [Rhodothermaceae bacterium]MYD19360.1 hypothetical protein [Rhodothermaceae bacterium]MYD57449.1 hypothetical protein [Rhodothermaceae bacterium]MYJ55173.1 hypothetical protein [Rhodothermaceae bacterium]
MNESLVDIVFVILAALIAVSVVPEFDIELPLSQEIPESGLILRPLQISITETGALYYLDQSSEEQPLPPQEFYEMVAVTQPTQTVEVHADQLAPAIYLLEVNRVIQNAGRNATFLVQAE